MGFRWRASLKPGAHVCTTWTGQQSPQQRLGLDIRRLLGSDLYGAGRRQTPWWRRSPCTVGLADRAGKHLEGLARLDRLRRSLKRHYVQDLLVVLGKWDEARWHRATLMA
jgi:hypothetical protein